MRVSFPHGHEILRVENQALQHLVVAHDAGDSAGDTGLAETDHVADEDAAAFVEVAAGRDIGVGGWPSLNDVVDTAPPPEVKVSDAKIAPMGKPQRIAQPIALRVLKKRGVDVVEDGGHARNA